MPLLATVLLTAALVQAPPAQDAPAQMTTYQMVLLRAAPQPKALAPADAKAMLEEHLAQLAALNKARVNVLYGPFLDTGDLRGIAILDIADADAARRAFANDPFVRAGHMTVEVKPWMGPTGWFHPPLEPNTPEPLVFGFLMRGVSSGPPAADAAAIQSAHLAYLAALHAQGTLVAAGPFGDASDMRGIVIYRVATVEEAQALAAGDPAVKAGRLRIEARPWMTFKGILK